MTEIINEEFKEQLYATIKQWMEESLDDALDAYLKEYLEDSDCRLLFEGGKFSALVGVGPNDACKSFDPILELDPYGYLGGPISQEQHDDVLEQIGVIRALIAKLEAGCRELERQAQAFKAKGAA
jgi:hypothetical protein